MSGTFLTSSMAKSSGKLHIAVFPWLAFGHMIPFLELSKLIAQKGHKISFISTPRNIDRLPGIPKSLSSLIHFVKLSLPPVPNLPPAAEATYDLPLHQVPLLKMAYDGLQDAIASFLQSAAPDWIIYDFAPYWLPPLAADFGISRAVFFIFGACCTCINMPPATEALTGTDPRKSPEEFTVPPKWVNFPTKVAFRLFEARQLCSFLKASSSDVSDVYRVGATISGCDVFAVKSCNEIENEWLKLLGEIHHKTVIPIGLLAPSGKEGKQEGMDEKWKQISLWLDKQRKESVLYVALGSEAVLQQEELKELALGLEKSGVPFLWVLRKQVTDDMPVELPERLEERIADRGVVWMMWAPQFLILGHESVGGFLTHCGWSSITEGLYFGRPLVMLPLVPDLGRSIFLEKQAGVEIPRNEENGSFTSDNVAESIKLIMADGINVYREKAQEMKKIVSDLGKQDKYIVNFLHHLETHKSQA